MPARPRRNVIADLNGSGATVREYIWLPEAEIAPTSASRAAIDRPVAAVDGVAGGSPTLYYVHADHLHRPIRMTDTAKAVQWSAEYQPWGAVQSLSGALTLDLRFPGQWFQLEAGLHYNWHRHYDPSLGRYTQPDPLGFVDGPSVYGYARSNPYRFADPSGRLAQSIPVIVGAGVLLCAAADFIWRKIKPKYIAPPAAANFNCRPGMCCLTGESEPTDGWGGKLCHYTCGANDRKTTERQSGKYAPCRSVILDEFNQGLLGK